MKVDPTKFFYSGEKEALVELTNVSGISFYEKDALYTAEEVLKKESRAQKKEKRKISLAFVDEEKMRQFNKVYRGKDYPTDVLSFFYNEKNILGEIVLCPQKIKKNAKLGEFKKEMRRVLIHGILHLFGYDHKKREDEEKMGKRTEYYL